MVHRATDQDIERIGKPSARIQPRARATFNVQTWWAISLGAVLLLYLATALGFQRIHNSNTVMVFNQITQQNEMPWYYEHPWFGAFVFAALPGLAFAWLFVTLKETRFIAAELRAEVADLTLHIQHTGYRLQGQLDGIATQVGSAPPAA
jgi:hypothetical protein